MSQTSDRQSAADELDTYLEFTAQRQRTLRATKLTDAGIRKVVKHAVPVRYRGTARMLLTDAMARREALKAKRFLDRSPLLLHLGSGGEYKKGWVNVDLVGDPVDFAWDLARPVPLPDNSADGIFHEHLLEHLPLQAGAGFLRECFRLLKPGAVLRVGVPDAGRLIESYSGDGAYLEERHPGRPTRLLAVQELFYWHRHCTMFDDETLAFVLRAAGLVGPRRREFGETDLPLAPDTPRRQHNTLYMEATKPAA